MKAMMIMVGCMLASALVLMVGCEKVQPQPVEDAAKAEAGDAQAQPPAGLPQPMGGTASTVVFKTAAGEAPITVEIAESDEQRAHGLMGRESLPEGNGMWFIFPQTGREKFWMKDTKIPLDIIYVGDDMKVVFIKENAVPESTELLESPADFRYVLEVNAGTAAKRGIKVGDTVEKRIGSK